MGPSRAVRDSFRLNGDGGPLGRFALPAVGGDAFPLGDRAKAKAEAIEFEQEVQLTKDDFGGWRVWYSYDPEGPKWRLAERETSRGGY